MSRKNADKSRRADYSIRTPEGKKVFDGFDLFSIFGWKVALHRFEGADAEGCFHTHLGTAYRLVLWGGYVEECVAEMDQSRAWELRELLGEDAVRFIPPKETFKRTWRPGMIGKITYDFEHRIDRLLNGKSSWTLWIRGPVTHKVEVRGC